MIAKNKIAAISYTLKYENKEGETIEVIDEKKPMEIIFGYGQLIEKFESELEGKKTGDCFAFHVKAEDAYGEYDDTAVVGVPKAELMDGIPKEEETQFFEGNIIPILDNEGNEYEAVVLEIDNDIITLDFNHPLAGEDLYFEGKIISVRDANPQEIKEAEAFAAEEEQTKQQAEQEEQEEEE